MKTEYVTIHDILRLSVVPHQSPLLLINWQLYCLTMAYAGFHLQQAYFYSSLYLDATIRICGLQVTTLPLRLLFENIP